MLKSLVLQEGPFQYHSDFPMELITGTGDKPAPRLRVDNAQTSFLEGRQFRVFREFNLLSGTSLFGRFINSVDVVILRRNITVAEGSCRFALSSGGTPSGTFTPNVIQPLNRMDSRGVPFYVTQALAASGGALTGQTEIEVQIIETTNQSASAQATAAEVGLNPGTWYTELRNTGNNALRGVYEVVWEEYQPRSVVIASG